MFENGNQRGSVLPNIFTERVVGIAFAAAFGLWAWYLNGLASTVMDGVADLREDNRQTEAQLKMLSSELSNVRLQVTQTMVQTQERQSSILNRMDRLEKGLEDIEHGRTK